jgi:hypothetical protein
MCTDLSLLQSTSSTRSRVSMMVRLICMSLKLDITHASSIQGSLLYYLLNAWAIIISHAHLYTLLKASCITSRPLNLRGISSRSRLKSQRIHKGGFCSIRAVDTIIIITEIWSEYLGQWCYFGRQVQESQIGMDTWIASMNPERVIS